MQKATMCGFVLLLLLWLPLHFAAQITPPLLSMARKLEHRENAQGDPQRKPPTAIPPALSAYLELFSLFQAYGFFADVRHLAFRFRAYPSSRESEAYEFPPESWTPFDYGLFELRLFEALAYNDEFAASYLGLRGCEFWPEAPIIHIEKLTATRPKGDAGTTALDFKLSATFRHSCSR